MDFKGKANHFWSAATPHKDCFYSTSKCQEMTFSSICLLPLPPRQEVDLRPRGRKCTSWWKGSGRRLRSTDRPAPSVVKATFMCKKNVRSLSCRPVFPVTGTWSVHHLLGSCRASSLRVQLGQTLLYICQRAKDPTHGDLWPQIWWENCKWTQNTSNTFSEDPSI